MGKANEYTNKEVKGTLSVWQQIRMEPIDVRRCNGSYETYKCFRCEVKQTTAPHAIKTGWRNCISCGVRQYFICEPNYMGRKAYFTFASQFDETVTVEQKEVAE